MIRLKMQTADMAERNIEMLGQMFPNCLTEVKNDEGKTVRAIDFDKLRQELACEVVEGAEERYQFTWPDKRAAIRLANAPTNKTLRSCREESVDFDNTENLYIEGDNLEVLKLLRENYLGKVKMIYIDPPYNTGNDFVYNDDFAQSQAEFAGQSGLFDEEGNRLTDPMVQNTESNGRFHTDWLNMIYPRLKVAKDLLADDGVIFISIDDGELDNLRKVCNELFGESNFIADLCVVNNLKGRNDKKYIARANERLLMYVKSKDFEEYGLAIKDNTLKEYKESDSRGKYRLLELRKRGGADTRAERPNMYYQFYVDPSTGSVSLEQDLVHTVIAIPMKSNGVEGRWRWGIDTARKNIDYILARKVQGTDKYNVYEKDYLEDESGCRRIRPKSIMAGSAYSTDVATKEYRALMSPIDFSSPKPVAMLKDLIEYATPPLEKHIILDFFSGSATTAHAVMQLNAEDGGNRRFIMVQLPEVTDEKSEAYKAGYKNICEIGKERIRRAGKKISDDIQDKIQTLGFTINSLLNAKPSATVAMLPKQEQEAIAKKIYNEQILPKMKEKEQLELRLAKLDTGFRVLKLDTSNMKDVYYTPAETPIQQTLGFEELVDNIKWNEGRTPEDLLFQVLPECNLPLSSKIEEREIHGKKVFVVEDGYLIACFDKDINESVITAIAKEKPYYFVMCDRSIATDNVADNFDQIFNAYSKETVRRII